MVVYQDTTPASAWLSCDCCCFRGSPLQLIARQLGLSEEAAVARLSAALGGDLDRQAEAWQRAILQRRLVDELLEKVRKGRAHNAVGLAHWPGSVPWKGVASSLVGWYDRRDVEAVTGPLGRSFDASIREVSVAPLYGPPGRVDGLWIWAESRGGSVELVRPVLGTRLPACLSSRAALDATPAGQTGFLFFHVRDALYLQLRQLADADPLLPLAGVPASAGDLDGILGRGRNLVLWTSGVIDERLIRQARLLNARVGRHRIEQETLSRYLSRSRVPVREWLGNLATAARDWRTALEVAVAGLPEVRVFAFLRGAGLAPSEIDEFARGLPGPLGDSVRRAAESSITRRPIVVGGRTVEESHEGWCNATGSLISNAVLRIEEIVRLPRRGVSYYRGRVLLDGSSHPFETPASEMDADTARWLDGFLAAHGEALVHDPAWGRRLANLARHFHKPAVVEACDSVGWDPSQRAFHFPRWSVYDGGKVVPAASRPPAALFYPLNPEPPSGLQLESAELPRAALAVCLALCVDTVLPALGGTSSGILVSGSADWLSLLGVPVASESKESNSKDNSGREDLLPAVVVSKDPLAALVAGVHGGRHVILAGAEDLVGRDNLSGYRLNEVAALLPGYLVDLTRRRLRLCRRQPTIGRLPTLLGDLADWTRRVGLDTKVVYSVMSSELRLDGIRASAVRCLADLIAGLLQAGDLSIVPERFYDPAEHRVVALSRGRLWFPSAAIDKSLAARGLPPIGHNRLVELLSSCPHAAGFVESVKNRRGVSVVESWWNTNIWSARDAVAS